MRILLEENPIVALFLVLAIIIFASRLGGGISRQLGQPRVLGELIIGVILGPTLLNALHWEIFTGIELEHTIKDFAEIGVVILMFLVGLEVNFSELTRVGKAGISAGIFGAVLPVMLTFPLLLLFNYSWEANLFAGVTLAATSVSISAQVLLEIGYLRTKVGNALLATALIDDVIAILMVSITVAIIGSSGVESAENSSIVVIILRMAIYLVIAFLIAWYVLPWLTRLVNKSPAASQSYGLVAYAIIIMLLSAWSAETLGGIATITGSFIAGLGLGRSSNQIRHDITRAISYIGYGFFVPIFFVNVGLETNLRMFPLSAVPLAGGLLLIAIASKIIGCGLGGKIGGLNNMQSLQLGTCMISRGEVGLIIISIGISIGLFSNDDPLYASLFLVILLTTLVTPIFVRFIFPTKTNSGTPVSTESTNS